MIFSSTQKLGRQTGVWLGVSMLFLAACGGDGCSMDGFRDEAFPLEHADKTVPVSAEVRITSHGLAFMSGQVENLVSEFQEGGLSFCIPPQEASGADICHEDSVCDDGTTGCQLNLTIDDATLVPEPSNTLMVHVTIGNLKNDLPVEAIGASCYLSLGSDSDFSQPAQIPATIPVHFAPDTLSPYRDMRFEIGELDVNIDDVDYRLTERDSAQWMCGGLGAVAQSLLDGTIRDLIQDEIKKVAEDLTRGQLCRQCGDGEPACPSNATCDGDGVCMYPDQDQCVPIMLGLEGAIEPQALLGDFLAGEARDIFMTGRVADRGVADTGMTLGARVGTEPEGYNRCAPVDLTTRPSFEPIDPSPSLNSDVDPDGDTFMFGMGIHRRTFQHLMWSLWASGAFCLEVGSEQVDMLTTGAIGALVPSVSQIALEPGPMKILLSPQKAPDIRLGANRITGSGNEQVVDEGLLILDWKDLDIHMYGYVLERYARLFTVRVDLELPIAVVPDGEEGLLPVLGDVEEAIQNVRILNDEILDADHDRIANLLPTLLGFALPELAGALSDPVELPQFLGYRVLVGDGDLRGVDNNQYLGLFANLEYIGVADPAPNALIGDVGETKVRMSEDQDGLRDVEVEVVASLREEGRTVIPGERVQYAYRLNGGLWHLLGTGSEGVLRLKDRRLRVQGEHRLELRARPMEEGARWVLLPRVDVVVDYEAPEVELLQKEGRLEVAARDVVDDVDGLRQRVRVIRGDVEGTWSSWGAMKALELDELSTDEAFVVQVEVKDRQGNVASEDIAVVRQAQEEEGEEDEGSGGCSTTGNRGNGSGFLLVLVGMVGLLRLRRKGFGAMLLVALGLAASGCGGCGGETSEEGMCTEECGPNESCVEGVCEPIVCTDASECELECEIGEVAACDDGSCACVAACDGGCEGAQFCCFESNSCQDYPDWCADTECDDGFQAEITHIGEANSESCEVTGGTCECVRMPPIPLWYHGAYPSMGKNGDLTVLSVHNLHYRDLMVGIVNDKYDVIDWHFVDGPPRRGTVQGDPDGYREGIINVGDKVGTHTATAVDAAGVIHVFYRDEDEDLLKYARGTSAGEEWSFEDVILDEEGDAGYYSQVLLKEDTLHLFYTVRLDDVASEIRYRAMSVDTPLGEMADSEVLVAHSGTSSAEGPEASPRVVGLHLQALEYDGGVFLSFFDNTIGQPGWIFFDGTTFGAPEYLGLGEPVGPYSSARPDADGLIHVVYMEQTPAALVYRTVGGAREEIASGVRHTLNGTVDAPVGDDARLHLYEDGRVEVLYHDATTHEFVRALRETEGSWTLETLDGVAGGPGAAHGLFPRVMELEDGTRLVVEFSIDTTGEVREGRPVLRLLD